MNTGGVLCLAVAFLSVMHAQERTGNQIFRVPPGWGHADQSGVTILSPTAEPRNYVVLMLGGHPLTGDFRAAFEQDVKGMNGTLRVMKASPVESSRTPDGVEMLASTVELRNPNGVPSLRYYLSANVGGRIEAMTFMAVSPLLFNRYWPAVQQFVSARTFDIGTTAAAPSTDTAAPAAPSAPAAASTLPPNRLHGVYSGYKYIYATTLGVVQKKAVSNYFSFFPDGTVYWGLPDSGLANFNVARVCAPAPEFCGTYQVDGDRVDIVLNRGTYRQVGTLTGSALQIEDRRYTLEGDISKSTAGAIEGVFGRADARPGEDLARRFIRFTRDGHFQDQGIVTTIVPSDISTGNPRFERAAGAGTFTLAPYTITLRYSDGYQRQLGVTVKPEDMEKPALTQLFVNTYTLVRRQ
jgi:hypothetical protein